MEANYGGGDVERGFGFLVGKHSEDDRLLAFRLSAVGDLIGQRLGLVARIDKRRVAGDEIDIGELRQQAMTVSLGRNAGALGDKINRPAARLTHRDVPASGRRV